ncbi:unknown [Crocosphaera subtropica ATCC 51142]|uniref:Uncharacterized protein n=1 Tax=Crocosphaera subtropica (strain ATCC 51142 / BH68) TaxID=43989 RepID=B1X2Y1_CROS5|nr:unknown [Crocosphaera subtropica ATCC 51142]
MTLILHQKKEPKNGVNLLIVTHQIILRYQNPLYTEILCMKINNELFIRY